MMLLRYRVMNHANRLLHTIHLAIHIAIHLVIKNDAKTKRNVVNLNPVINLTLVIKK
jgi:hypothetical protein